jgi:BlaI family transcriptional regulator, penicillinase repressor
MPEAGFYPMKARTAFQSGANFFALRTPLVVRPQIFIRTAIDSSHISCATVSNTMTGNITPEHDPAELGELERSILLIIWRVGTVTAEKVREELGRPLKDSTIRTVLRRLEEKGYLTHTVENRTFLYSPVESRQRVAGRAVQRIVDWFCEGSVEALLVGMVDSKVLGRAELQRLAERIATARKTSMPAKKETKP